MTALSNFLVLLALFLLASHANAFTSHSSVAGNKVWVNHSIGLQQPMSDPTNKPSHEPICKPTNDQINDQTTNQTTQGLEQDALLPDNLSSKMDDVIQIRKTHSEYTQSYQVAILVPFISFHSKSFGLAYCWVHSHRQITVDLFQALHSIWFACIKRSFTSARVLISTFNSLTLSSRMACWVCTLMVKVPLLHQTNNAVPSEWWHKQQYYVPFASCWDLHQSAKAALKAIVEVQASADKPKPNNASSFDDKPSSTLQLVVASVNDKLSKGSNKTNHASSFRHRASSTLQLVVASIDNKFSKGSTKSNNALPFGGKPNKSIDCKSPSSIFQFVVASIPILNPEGVQAPSNIKVYCCVNFVVLIIIPNFEEAQATPANSTLIVGYHYSKISLPFCKDCRIFCEGVKDDDDAFIEQQPGNDDDDVGNDEDKYNGISLVGLSGFNLVSLSGINGLIGRMGLVGLVGISCLVGGISLISLVGISGFGLVSLIGLGNLSVIGLIGLNGFSLISLIGPSGISGLVDHIGLDFIGHNGLVDFMGLGLDGFIGLGLIGFIGLSLGSLINGISLIGLLGLIGFIGLIGLVSFGLNGLIGKGIIVNSLQFEIEMKQSQHDLFQRESWLWCEGTVFSSLAGLDSVFGNALQNATQLFFDRIPQMTKYYVMRECENIHSWISLRGDLVFSHQQGIYGFKFPKRFLEISSRDLTLLSILII
jgi:hypothetical protein